MRSRNKLNFSKKNTSHKQHILGIDIGATKIAAGIGSTNGQLILRTTIPTPRGNPKDLIRDLTQLINFFKKQIDRKGISFDGIGIGICGKVDHMSGEVQSPIALGWHHSFPVREILINHTGKEVFIENDVNAGALGELLWGHARNCLNFIFLSLGTGIGAGIVINGELYRGAHAAAGEIGHVSIDLDGEVCSCGNRGCIEALAGGKSLSERITKEMIKVSSRLSPRLHKILRRNGSITAQDLFQAAGQGDKYSKKIILKIGEFLAVTIVNLMNLLDPEKIILGGGLVKSKTLLFSVIQKGLEHWHIFFNNHAPPVMISKFGADAGILGALGVAVHGMKERR